MRKDLTEIVLIVDCSGSMSSCYKKAEYGIRKFLDEQAASAGESLLTVCRFSWSHEVVHDRVPVKNVLGVFIEPTGPTALLDAVGSMIDKVGNRLRDTPEDQRPGLVVFVIVTDGEENSSVKYSLGQIKSMTKLQQDVYNWKFIYLGANQDAFHAGFEMGLNANSVANYSTHKSVEAYTCASQVVKHMRGQSVAGEVVSASMDDIDRKSIV